MTNRVDISQLEQLTKRTVRSFWLDGLWELVLVGAFLILGLWGMFYIQFVAFPESTWPFLHHIGRDFIWLGLIVVVIILAVYVWIGWGVMKKLKRRWISPVVGHAQHKFLMPVETKVYHNYFILYLSGIGLLYGLFGWVNGGVHVTSVPIIISPAAIYWAVGRIYSIRRYQWTAILGLVIAILLELLLTWPASYQQGAQNFLNIRPEWGSPALPSFIWAGVFLISGLIGFTTVRRRQYEA